MSRGTILVVEDDRDVREALCWLLEDAGYEVVAAENGEVALNLLRSRPSPPTTILLDLMMPVMDGWQFRAAQLADPQLASVPVICLTAHPDAERTSPELRVRAWMRKPLEFERLLDTIGGTSSSSSPA